jgi:hypothetical protein
MNKLFEQVLKSLKQIVVTVCSEAIKVIKKLK